jgi:hypothetical protein
VPLVILPRALILFRPIEVHNSLATPLPLGPLPLIINRTVVPVLRAATLPLSIDPSALVLDLPRFEVFGTLPMHLVVQPLPNVLTAIAMRHGSVALSLARREIARVGLVIAYLSRVAIYESINHVALNLFGLRNQPSVRGQPAQIINADNDLIVAVEESRTIWELISLHIGDVVAVIDAPLPFKAVEFGR